jgi:hypothetical protein
MTDANIRSPISANNRDPEQDRRRKQGESGPGKTGHSGRQQPAEHGSQETSGTDESEKAARLPRIEDLVGIGPELRDRYGKGHTQPNIVEGGNPSVAETEEIEEEDQTEHVEESRGKDQHRQPHPRHRP